MRRKRFVHLEIIISHEFIWTWNLCFIADMSGSDGVTFLLFFVQNLPYLL